MKKRLDLNKVHNPNCKLGCTREKRKTISENDLCTETNSVIDGLPIRCVGEWGIQKIFHLVQYFGIFAQGMKNSWKQGLNYFEICSGPGRSISRNNGSEFDGTALSILKHKSFPILQKALFFDNNEVVVDTLNKRISSLNYANATAFLGDYNYPDAICDILNEHISEGSLNLAFIDPTDCSVPFTLIRRIKQVVPNLDLIINLASGTDYNRNVVNALLNEDSYGQTVSKYSIFLGDGEFFSNPSNVILAEQGNHLELRNKFRDRYTESLRELGYKYFDFKRILHYYDLLFASEHPKGLEFWNKANSIGIDGQRELF